MSTKIFMRHRPQYGAIPQYFFIIRKICRNVNHFPASSEKIYFLPEKEGYLQNAAKEKRINNI